MYIRVKTIKGHEYAYSVTSKWDKKRGTSKQKFGKYLGRIYNPEKQYNITMETIQWTMTIPKDKQNEFVRYYDRTMRPTWIKFGATKCEFFKTFREKVAGENSFPEEQFVEILYLQEGLTAKGFFKKPKPILKPGKFVEQV